MHIVSNEEKNELQKKWLRVLIEEKIAEKKPERQNKVFEALVEAYETEASLIEKHPEDEKEIRDVQIELGADRIVEFIDIVNLARRQGLTYMKGGHHEKI